jgi:hypothetical protein
LQAQSVQDIQLLNQRYRKHDEAFTLRVFSVLHRYYGKYMSAVDNLHVAESIAKKYEFELRVVMEKLACDDLIQYTI